jgi:hypothetical protein
MQQQQQQLLLLIIRHIWLIEFIAVVWLYASALATVNSPTD